MNDRLYCLDFFVIFLSVIISNPTSGAIETALQSEFCCDFVEVGEQGEQNSAIKRTFVFRNYLVFTLFFHHFSVMKHIDYEQRNTDTFIL